jgi:hypothetical protein
MSTSSALGRVTGWIARTIRPHGRTFVARVVRHPNLSLDLEPLAERLVGDALVRFSGTHEPHRPDVLSCTIRFRHHGMEGDRDLLLASMKTRVEDYLGNDYYALSSFDVGLVHALYFRLQPEHASFRGDGDRDRRIDDAVANGKALLELEVGASPYGTWSPIVHVQLLHAANAEDAASVGFVHALRRSADAMSQWVRPRTVP